MIKVCDHLLVCLDSLWFSFPVSKNCLPRKKKFDPHSFIFLYLYHAFSLLTIALLFSFSLQLQIYDEQWKSNKSNWVAAMLQNHRRQEMERKKRRWKEKSCPLYFYLYHFFINIIFNKNRKNGPCFGPHEWTFLVFYLSEFSLFLCFYNFILIFLNIPTKLGVHIICNYYTFYRKEKKNCLK